MRRYYTVSWNLCPAPGTAAGKKGMGGVPHGTECFYAEDQRLTAVAGRGLHSFPFSLNLSLPCPFPLNLS